MHCIVSLIRFPPRLLMTWIQIFCGLLKTISVNTYSHFNVPFKAKDFTGQKYDLTGEIKESGLSVIFMTFQVDSPELTKPGEPYERFLVSLDEMDEILKLNNITRALNFAGLKQARKAIRSVRLYPSLR